MKYKKQLTVFGLMLVMIIVQISGSIVNASKNDFSIDVKYKGEWGLGKGAAMDIAITRDPNSEESFDTFEFDLMIRKEFVQGDSINFFSGSDESGNVCFVTEKTDSEYIGADGNTYVKYRISYNPNADKSILAAVLNMSFTLSQNSEMIEIKNPIVIESGSEVNITIPEVNIPDNGLTINKSFVNQYRQSDGQYKSIYNGAFRPFAEGDLIQFEITLSNSSSSEIKLNPGELKEYIYSGYEFFDVNANMDKPEYAGLKSANAFDSTSKNWEFSGSYSNYEEYSYNKNINIPRNGTRKFYIFATVKEASNSENLKNTATVESSQIATPPAITIDPPATKEVEYDMALATHFLETYANGSNKSGDKVTNLSEAVNPNISHSFSFEKASPAPIVLVDNKDVLRLRTYYLNQSDNDVANLKVALYIPDGLKLVDCDYSYESKGRIEDSRWNTSLYIVDLPDNTDGTKNNTVGYFDTLVEVTKWDKEYVKDYFVGAEIAEFTDLAGNVVEDTDSTPDSTPHNDMWKMNNPKSQKEVDNVVSQDAKNNVDADEDDFDFAYFRVQIPTEKRQFNKSINTSGATYIYEQSKKNGYTYANEYIPISNTNAILSPYTYIGYAIKANSGGMQDLNNVEITDKLPKGLKYLKDDNGNYVYRIEVYRGAEGYENGFPEELWKSDYVTKTTYYSWESEKLEQEMNITVDIQDEENLLTLKGERFEHIQVHIDFLATVDIDQMNMEDTYKNTAILKADEIERREVESAEITWESSSAIAFAKKFIKIGGNYENSNNYNVVTTEDNQFTVDYRIQISTQSSGDGFKKGQINLIDNVGSKATSISPVVITGVDKNGVEINDQATQIFTAEVDGTENVIEIINKVSVPANSAYYYFDFSVTYGETEDGEAVYNQLFSDKLYTVKPLKLQLEKKNVDGELLEGAEFLLLYENGDPVLNQNGEPIQINPNTENDTAIFIPQDYLTTSEWILTLKEINTPEGYQARDYKIVVTKDYTGNLTMDFSDNEDLLTRDLESSKVFVINEKITTTDPEDPDPIVPETPDPTDPEIPTDPETPTDPDPETPTVPTPEPSKPTEPESNIPDMEVPKAPATPEESEKPSNPSKPEEVETPEDSTDEIEEPEEEFDWFDDGEIPLGDFPGDDALVELNDPSVPLGSMTDKKDENSDELDDVPKTGDNTKSNTGVMALMTSALLALLGVFWKKKN